MHYTSLRKTNLIVFCILFIFSITPHHLFAQSLDDKDAIRLLMTAKDFFKTIGKRDYAVIWDSITVKSRKQIIKSIHKAQKKTGEISTIEEIKEDFNNCAITCKAFWNAYFKAFDPNVALRQSRWEIGFIKKRKAEIWVTHRDSERPAKLKIVKEEGRWKVGLMESFWRYGTGKR